MRALARSCLDNSRKPCRVITFFTVAVQLQGEVKLCSPTTSGKSLSIFRGTVQRLFGG